MITECTLIGTSLDIRPSITEISIEPGITIIAPSAGMIKAGINNGQKIDLIASISSLMEIEFPTPDFIAESLLNRAVKIDHEQPQEDMSVVVLQISDERKNSIRRIQVSMPFLKLT